MRSRSRFSSISHSRRRCSNRRSRRWRLDLPRGTKMILEKPFDENRVSAQDLNRLLHESFPERDVFRLDHFLGKQTVQNILGLRVANRVFEPLWNYQHIERVEIIRDETLTAAGRASSYDTTGALRDTIQNHLHRPQLIHFAVTKRAFIQRVERLHPDHSQQLVGGLDPEARRCSSQVRRYSIGRSHSALTASRNLDNIE